MRKPRTKRQQQLKKALYAEAYGAGQVGVGLILGEYPPPQVDPTKAYPEMLK